jgi:hypothetical protein
MGHIISIARCDLTIALRCPQTHICTYPLSHLPSASNRNGGSERVGPEHTETCPTRIALTVPALLLLATMAIYIVYRRANAIRKCGKLPDPAGLPLLGNISDLPPQSRARVPTLAQTQRQARWRQLRKLPVDDTGHHRRQASRGQDFRATDDSYGG